MADRWGGKTRVSKTGLPAPPSIGGHAHYPVRGTTPRGCSAPAARPSPSGFDRVVKLTVFLTDLGDPPAFRAVRDEFMDQAAPAASSLVQVSGLVHPDFRVEIEALALG